MRSSFPSRHTDVLFAQLEREAADPVLLYRRLLRRAVAQLDARAAESTALRGENETLRVRCHEQAMELQELRHRLTHGRTQRTPKPNPLTSRKPYVCDIPNGEKSRKRETPLTRADSHPSWYANPNDAHTHRDTDRILCDILLLAISDEPAEASNAEKRRDKREKESTVRNGHTSRGKGGLGETDARGLADAAMSAVQTLQKHKASLRQRVAELESALRFYESQRLGHCAESEKDATDALKLTEQNQSCDDSDMCLAGQGSVEGSGEHIQDDLVGEEELIEYAEWRQDFINEIMSAK